jgi:hypothetical protein
VTPEGHAYTCTAVANAALTVRDIPAHVSATLPEMSTFAAGVSVNGIVTPGEAAVPVPLVTTPLDAVTDHVALVKIGVFSVAVTEDATLTVSDVGNV